MTSSSASNLKAVKSLSSSSASMTRSGGKLLKNAANNGLNQAMVLSDLGFAGIIEAGSFQNLTKQRKTKNSILCCEVIDAIVKRVS